MNQKFVEVLNYHTIIWAGYKDYTFKTLDDIEFANQDYLK